MKSFAVQGQRLIYRDEGSSPALSMWPANPGEGHDLLKRIKIPASLRPREPVRAAG